MFIISLHYTGSLEQIDARMPAHRAWLAEHYAQGTLLMSGPKVPREGGIVLARAGSRSEVEALVRTDPFNIAGIAQYQITEFVPNQTAEPLAALRNQ
jgi:uncharacterized protein YciI